MSSEHCFTTSTAALWQKVPKFYAATETTSQDRGMTCSAHCLYSRCNAWRQHACNHHRHKKDSGRAKDRGEVIRCHHVSLRIHFRWVLLHQPFHAKSAGWCVIGTTPAPIPSGSGIDQRIPERQHMVRNCLLRRLGIPLLQRIHNQLMLILNFIHMPAAGK